MTIIQEKLKMTQREMFRITCFGHFLNMYEHQFNVMLIYLVLFYLINRANTHREIWFKINGIDVCFNPLKFAMVTQLIIGDDTNMSSYRVFQDTPIMIAVFHEGFINKLF